MLPAQVPNLLLNGTTGIAVGMATDIPPHNLREVVNGIHLLDDPDATIDALCGHIRAPDFPTDAEMRHPRRSGIYTGPGAVAFACVQPGTRRWRRRSSCIALRVRFKSA